MAQTKLPLAKRITVNGHGETGSRAESSLRVQERAVIYYTNNSGEETAVDVESLSQAPPRTLRARSSAATGTIRQFYHHGEHRATEDKSRIRTLVTSSSGQAQAYD